MRVTNLPDSPETISDFWHPIPGFFNGLNNKKGTARFVYLLLLHFFYHQHKFPDFKMMPKELILYGLKNIAPGITLSEIANAFQQDRQIFRYKDEIRKAFGFRVFKQNDIKTIKKGFSVLFSKNLNKESLKEALCAELDRQNIESLDEAFQEKLIKEILLAEEEHMFCQINEILTEENKKYIDDYILSSNDFGGVCQFLRQSPSNPSRENVKDEIKRLEILEQLRIERFDFINSINTKQRNIYKRRFFTDTPERTKRRTDITRYALAVLFFWQRHQEAIDNLVEYILSLIHQIKKTGDRKTEKLNSEIIKRMGDLDDLYQIAEINRDYPKDIIEEVVYKQISQKNIDQIIKTRDFARHAKILVRESIIKRYSTTYRSSLFNILDCLEFGSNNADFLDAINLIKRYQKSSLTHYPKEEKIPIDSVISKQQQKLILDHNETENPSVRRKDYEYAIFKLLRIKLRHKEVWVNHAFKYRNPIDDLPKDFGENLEYYFNMLNAPLLAKEFISNVKNDMVKNIKSFDDDFPKNDFVKIIKKKDKPWIKLSPLEKVEEPKSIQRIKDAILVKWGMIDLLDILKEVDLRENFTDCCNTAGNREILDRKTIRKRLLLSIFAIGTNAGLTRIAGASKGIITFEELRHIKKYFLNKDDLREAINTIINAIFRLRNPKIWRSVSTACAADSKQFGCYTKNIMSEWSPRHHNNGVMIYWHVSDQYICIYSQLKTCTSSEVASMLQGIMSQETDMEIESQYVDSHGKSELGFALSYLEKFDLLPRYKTIGNQKIYLPSDDFQVKNIEEITTRSIDWDLIEEQYYEMIKHAVALKLGTATAETIIRKFAPTNYQHLTFKAFMELGKAVKSIFLCRYLNSVELRQQINAGLNVVENWNSANEFVYYGKSGEINSNSPDDQEISMLCLHLLQTSISYVNTLLIEDLLQDDYWKKQLTQEDYRALTALFYLHINPYGTFELDLTKRLLVQHTPPTLEAFA